MRKDIDRMARVRRESPRSDGSLVQRWHLHTVDGTRPRPRPETLIQSCVVNARGHPMDTSVAILRSIDDLIEVM